ncbi:choice-of-anchor B family protein [uncultured Winogradskyella sp.]|uniref:choice-of-anchor B family protein n=1 Tax=uncultured Winogradskyella sp. TaxID=395353 RepID=UPI002620FDB0|nr:choice-of-anchor B family protein [uncultured Winogradskyella sp.]
MKNKLPHFLFFLITLSQVIYSQTNCINGFAGEYPCNNLDLMANIPISVLANTSGNPEGSDVWGWTDPMDNKEYAIVATTNSTAFVDISDPINPVFLGRLDTSAGTNFWRDVKVYNDHAFIVADNVGPHGMQVFDLKRLRNVTSPQTFTADAIFNGVNSCHNIVINETIGVAYLVGCNTFGGGPHFIDISNPLNPLSLGGYAAEGYTHDAQVITYNGPDPDYTGREILIGSNETKVVILDVTDKNNVIKIKDVDYPQIGYTHQGWFTDDQRYFILGDETDEQNYGINTRTIIFDFLDLDNPTQSSTYFGNSSAIDHNGYVLGNEFYLASYRAGLRLLDISNIQSPTNPMTEIAYFDTYPDNDGTAFNGAWSVYPYFSSGNIVISDIERGLFVVRKNQTLSVKEETADAGYSLSPNPTNASAQVKASQNQIINSIEIYNNLGQIVYSNAYINNNNFTLPTQNYTSGLYLVRINNKVIEKLVIK